MPSAQAASLSSELPSGDLLIFAGAGISMVAPSCLPNWWSFNEAVVGALTERLARYTRQALGGRAFEQIISRRDGSTTFAPDYMADLMAEECGVDYFRVLQALDTESFNAAHGAVADLASTGKGARRRCKAIVTTNFDRLFERALDDRGVPYEVFFSPQHFEGLVEKLRGENEEEREERPLPLIKVHGSVEAPETMVDTLSQRLMGRPESLENALQLLYRRHHLVIMGFSGADLDYDPHYLGLKDAAQQNRGFTYLAMDSSRVKPAIRDLKQAWGEGAKIVEGRLPGWLTGEAPEEVQPVDRLPAVQAHAARWAESLGDLQATNILTSLLRASGDEHQAGYVFYQVFRHYRRMEDTAHMSYARFNHQLGRYLLEYGWHMGSLRPKGAIVRSYMQTDKGVEMVEGDPTESRDNAFQFLARAFKQEYSPAYTELALCHALMGKVDGGVKMITRAVEVNAEAGVAPSFFDAAIVGGTIWAMGGRWTDGLLRLEAALGVATKLGQEARRARLLAPIVRFRAWKERPEAAEEAYREGCRIAERLGLEGARLRLDSAWGYALYESKRYQEGVDLLLSTCSRFHRTGRKLDLTRAALDLFDCAYGLWEQEPVNQAFSWLEEHEFGYQPHVHMAYAEFFLRNEQYEDAAASIRRVQETAEETENTWAKDKAKSLRGILRQRGGEQEV